MGRFKFNEKAGLWYEFNGEYYLPCLAMPEEEHRPIGKWGRRHRDFLKRHRKATYISLLTTGTVDAYLADLDEQAAERFERLVSQMAEKQGVTAWMKAVSPMLRMGRINAIREAAEERINTELIFAP